MISHEPATRPRSRTRNWRRVLAAAPVALLLAGGLGTATAAPAGVADDRFDDITGPMGPFVVRPDAFGLDANRVLADVPSLLASVDQARAKSVVESLAFPRTSAGPALARQQATDLVTQQFIDAGYTPRTQSVVLPATGHDMPNVYAELPGTQCSDRVLVVGAHYDSATEGNPAADDNASGVAGLFELARALRDHPLPVTVRFVAFSYEEDGLVGSFAMAQRDLAEHNDIIGALSLEMIGFTTAGVDALTGLPPTFLAMVADPASASMAHAFGAAAYTYTPSFPAFAAVIDPAVLSDIYRSDHAAYALNGIPGLMATDTANFRNPNYHKVTDTVDTIDWDFLANSARSALAGVAVFGSSDQDLDGTADACGPAAPPVTPPPSTPVTTLPHTAGAGNLPPAPVARPVAATARYTG
jgi:hypothetical protein